MTDYTGIHRIAINLGNDLQIFAHNRHSKRASAAINAHPICQTLTTPIAISPYPSDNNQRISILTGTGKRPVGTNSPARASTTASMEGALSPQVQITVPAPGSTSTS